MRNCSAECAALPFLLLTLARAEVEPKRQSNLLPLIYIRQVQSRPVLLNYIPQTFHFQSRRPWVKRETLLSQNAKGIKVPN